MAKVTLAMLEEFGNSIESQGNLRTERGRNRDYSVNGDYALQPKERKILLAGIGRRAVQLKADVKATSEADVLASALITAPEDISIEVVKDTATSEELQATVKVIGRLAKDAGIFDEFKSSVGKRLSSQVATASNPEATSTENTPVKKGKKAETVRV